MFHSDVTLGKNTQLHINNLYHVQGANHVIKSFYIPVDTFSLLEHLDVVNTVESVLTARVVPTQ